MSAASSSRARPVPAVRLGVAHHLGWAIVVSATDDHEVLDRRRIELVGPGIPTAPIEHEGKALDDTALESLVAKVRASATRATSASLDELVQGLERRVVSISLRSWALDFPDDLATQRRPPYDSRADSVMYLQVLSEVAHVRGWRVHLYDAKEVEGQASRLLGPRADEVLRGPRAQLGPPWSKDHRMALAATVIV